MNQESFRKITVLSGKEKAAYLMYLLKLDNSEVLSDFLTTDELRILNAQMRRQRKIVDVESDVEVLTEMMNYCLRRHPDFEYRTLPVEAISTQQNSSLGTPEQIAGILKVLLSEK